MVAIEEIPTGETDRVYKELVSFLCSTREDLRSAAAEATLSALSSDSHEAAAKLASLNVIKPLCRVASSTSGSLEALASLNLLCAHELVGNNCVLDFIEVGGVSRMIEICLEPFPASADGENAGEWKKRVNLACALLANSTRVEKGAVEFVGLSLPEEAVYPSQCEEKAENPEEEFKRDTKPTATLLLSRLLNHSFIDTGSVEYKNSVKLMSGNNEYDSDFDENDLETPDNDQDLDKEKIQPVKGDENEYYDPYQHLASVLMNITQLESGRKFLMKLNHKQSAATYDKSNSSSHLQTILSELNSPNIHRRRGIAGTLKNCCFSQDSTWWLLNVVYLDKAMLLPLAGPEELDIDEKVGLDPDYWLLGPSKVREPDSLVRLYLVEALLLLLASGRASRETLRQRRTYVIIKMADMVEEKEEISERMNECVQYLRRDEDGEEEGTSDRKAYEYYARGMLQRNEEWDSKLLSDGKAEEKEDTHEADYDHVD